MPGMRIKLADEDNGLNQNGGPHVNKEAVVDEAAEPQARVNDCCNRVKLNCDQGICGQERESVPLAQRVCDPGLSQDSSANGVA